MPDRHLRPDSPEPVSVWLTGQACSRDQRRHRYTRASIAHPGKMLPAIARHAITTWTRPGEIVLDPMAGIGTSIVEAMHLGRHGLGVEYEARWSRLAADNIVHATRHGAPGPGRIWCGDSRHLAGIVPKRLHRQVALVLTSPPYGASTHGQVRTPGPRGKVDKIDHRYGSDPANLAYTDLEHLTTGFTDILTASAALLRPGGTVMVTARPYRHHGELIDIPGMVIAAGTHAGLRLTERCVALIAAVRNGRLVTRASFFQQHNIRLVHATGDPQWLVAHEDVLVFVRDRNISLSAWQRSNRVETSRTSRTQNRPALRMVRTRPHASTRHKVRHATPSYRLITGLTALRHHAWIDIHNRCTP